MIRYLKSQNDLVLSCSALPFSDSFGPLDEIGFYCVFFFLRFVFSHVFSDCRLVSPCLLVLFTCCSAILRRFFPSVAHLFARSNFPLLGVQGFCLFCFYFSCVGFPFFLFFSQVFPTGNFKFRLFFVGNLVRCTPPFFLEMTELIFAFFISSLFLLYFLSAFHFVLYSFFHFYFFYIPYFDSYSGLTLGPGRIFLA